MDKVLTPFWNRSVELLPLWMAPNLVTLIGLFVLALNAAYYLYHDLTMSQHFNPFWYFISALSYFFYQTMDAIDGKQARRTGTSSPLGQLFDHGCDAWSSFITVFIPIQVMKVGATTPFFLYFTGVQTIFYLANWEEYHTDILRCSYGIFGLTECQLVIIGLIMIQALSGGQVSEVTMRAIGRMILPEVRHDHVHTKI